MKREKQRNRENGRTKKNEKSGEHSFFLAKEENKVVQVTFPSPRDGAPRRRALPIYNALCIRFNVKSHDAELEAPCSPRLSAFEDKTWRKKRRRRRHRCSFFNLLFLFVFVVLFFFFFVAARRPPLLPQGQARGFRAPTWDHLCLREREGSDRRPLGSGAALEQQRLCHFFFFEPLVLLLFGLFSSAALAQRADHGAADLRERRAQGSPRDPVHLEGRGRLCRR